MLFSQKSTLISWFGGNLISICRRQCWTKRCHSGLLSPTQSWTARFCICNGHMTCDSIITLNKAVDLDNGPGVTWPTFCHYWIQQSKADRIFKSSLSYCESFRLPFEFHPQLCFKNYPHSNNPFEKLKKRCGIQCHESRHVGKVQYWHIIRKKYLKFFFLTAEWWKIFLNNIYFNILRCYSHIVFSYQIKNIF